MKLSTNIAVDARLLQISIFAFNTIQYLAPPTMQ